MIVCLVEYWPRGDRERAQPLGLIEIVNDGSGTRDVGNYRVTCFRPTERGQEQFQVWRSAEVRGFRRLKLGPFALLFLALQAIFSKRGREDRPVGPVTGGNV